jgi:hypothetical protein
VGAPVAGALQWTLGSSRPLEGIGSEWHPFADNNGVSAHAFVGAIPFLSAAAGVRNRAAKSALLLVSTLCGLSRINDDMHYVSQAGLGWWIAWLSASAVERTDRSPGSATVFPVAGRDLAGMGVGWRF